MSAADEWAKIQLAQHEAKLWIRKQEILAETKRRNIQKSLPWYEKESWKLVGIGCLTVFVFSVYIYWLFNIGKG